MHKIEVNIKLKQIESMLFVPKLIFTRLEVFENESVNSYAIFWNDGTQTRINSRTLIL